MTVNKPPKLDTTTAADEDDGQNSSFFANFVFDAHGNLDAPFRAEGLRVLQRHEDKHQDDGPATLRKNTFMPFSRDDYDRFRWPRRSPEHPGEGAGRRQERRRGTNGQSKDDEEEDYAPCPDVEWELEQNIPVEGSSWNKRKRSFKRRAMLLTSDMVHTTGSYF